MHTTAAARTASLMDALASAAPTSGLARETARLAAGLRASGARSLEDYFRAAEGLPNSDTAVLPGCSGFVGAGTRCESCRVRKALHS